jgi:hypothetical protein
MWVVVFATVGGGSSSLHEALAEMFRNRPELAAKVAGCLLHLELPEYREAASLGDLDDRESFPVPWHRK